MKVYIDECGDLGFSPRATRFFVVAFFISLIKSKLRSLQVSVVEGATPVLLLPSCNRRHHSLGRALLAV